MRTSGKSASGRRGARGFTLIELMVGVLIGLLASLAVTQVLVNSEGQKRSTVSGSDAQVNGALALLALQRAVAPAGYGFSNNFNLLGCTLAARYNSAAPAGFPTVLAPVIITQGAGGAPDTVRVIASAKSTYSLPIRVVAPGYNPGNPSLSTAFPVAAVGGVQGPVTDGGGTVIEPGELMVAAPAIGGACEVFQVTAAPTSSPATVVRTTNNAKWNMAGFPAANYGEGNYLLNLGTLIDETYSVSGSSTLQVNRFTMAADSSFSYDSQALFPNVVQIRALYGKDSTGGTGSVNTWDNVTPTDNAGWRQLRAVRLAIVTRSDQFERENVTFANPQWNVGTAVTITGTTTCGTSQCLSLKVDNLPDWQRYRYKIFETVIPLRNMLWTS